MPPAGGAFIRFIDKRGGPGVLRACYKLILVLLHKYASFTLFQEETRNEACFFFYLLQCLSPLSVHVFEHVPRLGSRHHEFGVTFASDRGQDGERFALGEVVEVFGVDGAGLFLFHSG